MKKLGFLLLSILISVQLNAQGNKDSLVTISLYQAEFSLFINEIESQSHLDVVYKSVWFSEYKVDINIEQKPAIDALEDLLKKSNFSVYRWGNKLLILKEEELIESLPNYNEGTVVLEEEVEDIKQSDYIQGRRADLIKIKVGKSTFQKQGGLVNIKGSVVDAATGKAIEGATLYISKLQKGAISDVDGVFDFSIPLGTYSAKFDCLGSKALMCQLEVASEGSFEIALEKEKFEIQEIQIYGDKQMDIREKEPGLEKLNVKAIKELPTMMGESDIIKVTEMLPGVVSVGEGAAGLNVRGGGFDQNAFYFNKISVYNTSHLFGFFPAFNADVIQDFSLYKGYVPAKYGGRLSSIFIINARRGNKKNYTAHGGISPITANITVEGPIKKDTASFLVNFRTSYSDWILRQIKNYDIQNSEAQFYDLTASLDYDLPNTQVNVFGYHSQDYFKFSDLNTFWYSNSGLSTSFGHLFSSDFRSDFSISASRYQFKTIDENKTRLLVRTNGLVQPNLGGRFFDYIGFSLHFLMERA
jgi:hypothetical protein